MRRLPLLFLALTALAGCHRAGGDKVDVRDAWVRLSAVPGHPAAAYFTVQGSSSADTLTAVHSAVVGRIELHEAGMADGMAMMKPIASVAVPASGSVVFAPGGRHAMLFDVNPQITPGTAIPLNFAFASGKRVEVEAKTVAAGAASPE